MQNHIGNGLLQGQATHPVPQGPFHHLVMDLYLYVLNPNEIYKYCLVIDIFFVFQNDQNAFLLLKK